MPSEEELQQYYTHKYLGEHSQVNIQLSEREYYKSHANELLRYIKLKPSKTTIVDYGCSYPVFLTEAKQMGCIAVGVEWDKDCIDYGLKNNILMINPNEFTYKIKDNSVDIIRFSHVLEHSIDPLSIIKTAVKKLKPNGIIYITQPNFPVFLHKEIYSDLKDTIYPEHLHFFSPLSMKILVEQCDLKIEKFFTHQNSDDVLQKYILNLDIFKSAKSLYDISELGDMYFGPYSNYPLYCGENSVLYARLVK